MINEGLCNESCEGFPLFGCKNFLLAGDQKNIPSKGLFFNQVAFTV